MAAYNILRKGKFVEVMETSEIKGTMLQEVAMCKRAAQLEKANRDSFRSGSPCYELYSKHFSVFSGMSEALLKSLKEMELITEEEYKSYMEEPEDGVGQNQERGDTIGEV